MVGYGDQYDLHLLSNRHFYSEGDSMLSGDERDLSIRQTTFRTILRRLVSRVWGLGYSCGSRANEATTELNTPHKYIVPPYRDGPSMPLHLLYTGFRVQICR